MVLAVFLFNYTLLENLQAVFDVAQNSGFATPVLLTRRAWGPEKAHIQISAVGSVTRFCNWIQAKGEQLTARPLLSGPGAGQAAHPGCGDS